MEAQIWVSDLSIYSNCDSKYMEKAWYIASILLFLGRSASPEEIAERSSLFRASPEFVEFLCSVPNSPIYLSANNFVVISMPVFRAVGEFFARSMPKFEYTVCGGERMFRSCGEVVRTYFRKRKKLGNEMLPVLKKRAVLRSVDGNEREIAFCEGLDLQSVYPGTALNALSCGRSYTAKNLVSISDKVVTPTLVNSNIGLLDYQLNVDKDMENGNKQNTSVVNDIDKFVVMEEHQDKCYANETSLDLPSYHDEISTALLLEILADCSAMLEGNNHDLISPVGRIDSDGPSRVDLNQLDKNISMESIAVTYAATDFRYSQIHETTMKDMSEQPLMDNGGPEGRIENSRFDSCRKAFSSVDRLHQTNMEIINRPHTLKEEPTNINTKDHPLGSDSQSSGQKAWTNSSVLKNVPQGEVTQKQQTISNLIEDNKVDSIRKERRGQNNRNDIALMEKSTQIARNHASIQERSNNAGNASKDQQKSKFPEFESYTVEEKEGSGGYGTVYRARRKSDGLMFAIKCPHANAYRHYVRNELKMLERFGGKNFVIKYESSLKSETSDCLVMEHVEHNRPEVLKKEIDMYQLRWYGYCMFRALVSLHKQGVFHRDIKPGNFLFSCKTNKGYLIDFNLAKDMNQKHVNIEKSHSNVTAVQQIPSVHSMSGSPCTQKKTQGGKISELLKPGVIGGSNLAPESKKLKKKAVEKLKAYEDLGRCNSLTSQGADGSSITSMRDMTSTRTPSAERPKRPQPLYCKGRKELINFAQEAMKKPNLGAPKAPSSNRKRVAASPEITSRLLIHPTPIPLHSSGVMISRAGSLKNREVKPNKDGPSPGTKGFRAPEVLLRSLHQGPKVDVWSAGVTLLYLISGKMPFNGDPEQNMKDIVKMKGNEELWEVAKLHNRESSFPMELLDIRYLPSMTIKDWYSTNTKRRDLLEVLPNSLFDLLEKCLTVSPRLRISADEALSHEFFASCHDELHQQRLSRRVQNQDAKSNSLSLLCEPVRPPKEKLIAPVNF